MANDRDFSKVKILLIDDSDMMLKHLTNLLKPKGFTLYTAINLKEALENIERYQPHALLIDFVLSDGNTAINVIQAIQALSEEQKLPSPLCAILTQGGISEDDSKKAKKQGIQVLQKPKRGKEQEFLQNIEFWLHDAELIR